MSSALQFDTLNTRDGSSSIPVERLIKGACAAWVNFAGTSTVSIRASYNVASITDNGTGDYTVNFAVPMFDTNYCVSSGGRNDGASNVAVLRATTAPTSSSQRIVTIIVNTAAAKDLDIVDVAIFR